MLKSVNQEHIVRLHEAYLHDDFLFLAFEKLFGENCVRSISLKNKYDEYLASHIIKQVRIINDCRIVTIQYLKHYNCFYNDNFCSFYKVLIIWLIIAMSC